jgi:hypothetical protein
MHILPPGRMGYGGRDEDGPYGWVHVLQRVRWAAADVMVVQHGIVV